MCLVFIDVNFALTTSFKYTTLDPTLPPPSPSPLSPPTHKKKNYLIPPKKFPSLIPFLRTFLIAPVTSPLAPLARSIASKSVCRPRYPSCTAGKSIDWVWRGIEGAKGVGLMEEGEEEEEERERREARRRCLADLAVLGLLVRLGWVCGGWGFLEDGEGRGGGDITTHHNPNCLNDPIKTIHGNGYDVKKTDSKDKKKERNPQKASPPPFPSTSPSVPSPFPSNPQSQPGYSPSSLATGTSLFFSNASPFNGVPALRDDCGSCRCFCCGGDLGGWVGEVEG